MTRICFRACVFSLALLSIVPIIAIRANAFSTKSAESGGGSSADTVWISRKDGGTSCGIVKAQSLEDGANELTLAGVRVLNSRKAGDGKMMAQMCGIPTGTANAYQISRADLPKALSLGFHESK